MKEGLMTMVVSAVAVLIAVSAWIFTSHHESKVYNRLTGANTTTYDAMFVQLRVVEPFKENKDE